MRLPWRRRPRPWRPETAGGEWLLVRSGLPATEAHVAVGFLQAQGIRAGIRASDHGLAAKGPPLWFDLYADPERAAEARALLEEV